jgi:hypothetical protein
MTKRRKERRINDRRKGPRRKKGPRGRRGPIGPPGLTGQVGRRGKIGKAGQRGPNGLTGPLHKDNVLDMVMTHFDDVYQQLNIQMKRISEMQQQVDMLTARGTKDMDADD